MAKCLHAAYDNDAALPDAARLVLAPHQLWCVFVDATVLYYDGNAMDALSLGVSAISEVFKIFSGSFFQNKPFWPKITHFSISQKWLF